ncbi:MAG TPA: carboxypeptidase regulatory-like domain-containing protein [Pyrinomonadaceae bacterium]|nr:carboxypeptidase regulatory-like domain-containing protein [Pyrinomonadaceae bacterium]
MRTRRFYSYSLSVLLLTVFGYVLVVSQTRRANEGTIEVVVKDPSDAVIPGARLQLIKDSKPGPTAQSNQKGEAHFNRLAVAKYQLVVEAAGFKAKEIDIDFHPGENKIEVSLEIDTIKADVEVSEEARVRNTDPKGSAFTNVLTEEQIAQLPDDPDEFENAINQLAGPGAQMRVNGFRGGKLPPKSQIREIRFRLNPYAPENHDAGFGLVDIITKPGVNAWHGSFNFGFRDESLNGRQAFATFRGPEQQRRFGLSLEGPLWKNRTSLFLNADGSLFYDAKTIVATLPTGPFTDLSFRPTRRLNLDARVEHALTKTHTSRFQYQRNASLQNNLGTGDYDLDSRGYSQNQVEHIVRFADSGVFGKKFFNEARVQARWLNTEAESVTNGQTILVPGAFNAGSAQRSGGRKQLEFEVANNVDYALEKHGVRFGMQLEAGRYQSNDSTNRFGTFQFANLTAFQLGLPTQYTQRIGDPTVKYSQYQFGWYLQDDYRLRKNLTLSYGVRQEFQTNLGDNLNVAPRLGFIWSPLKSGTVTVRGGAGVFYDWFAAQTYEQTLRVDGQRQRDLVISHPGFPDPISGGFQTILPPSRIQSDANLVMPYIIQASLGLETTALKLVRLTTNYQYQRGVHLLHGQNLNAPVPGLGRPDPTAGNITNIESSAYLSAHRLMIGIGPAKFVNGFFWNANYLMMKATNEADSPFSLPANNFNLHADRGPAASDLRYLVSGFFSRRLKQGFALSAIVQATSALPYNITTGFDNNQDTVINDRPLGVGRNSARGASRWEIGSRLSWGKDFGPDEKQAVGGPQIRMVRLGGPGGEGAVPPSLPGGGTKKFRLELYAQVSNLLNHTNLGSFAGVQTSPFYGQATSAQAPRRMEVGMRLNF